MSESVALQVLEQSPLSLERLPFELHYTQGLPLDTHGLEGLFSTADESHYVAVLEVDPRKVQVCVLDSKTKQVLHVCPTLFDRGMGWAGIAHGRYLVLLADGADPGYYLFGAFVCYDMESKTSCSMVLDRCVDSVRTPFQQDDSLVFPALLSEDNQCDGEGRGLYFFKVTPGDNLSLQLSELQEDGNIETYQSITNILTKVKEPQKIITVRKTKPGVGSIRLSPTYTIVARHGEFDLYVDGKYTNTATVAYYSSTTSRCDFITTFFEEKSIVPVLLVHHDASQLVVLKISGHEINVVDKSYFDEKFYHATSWGENEIALWDENNLIAWEFREDYNRKRKEWGFVGVNGKLQIVPHQLVGYISTQGQLFAMDESAIYCIKADRLDDNSSAVNLRDFSIYLPSLPPKSLSGTPKAIVYDLSTTIYWVEDTDPYQLHVLEITCESPLYLDENTCEITGDFLKFYKKALALPNSEFHQNGWKQRVDVLVLDNRPGFFLCHGDVNSYLIDAKLGTITKIGSLDEFARIWEFPIVNGEVRYKFSGSMSVLRVCHVRPP